MNLPWKIQFRRSWILCRTFGAGFMDRPFPRPYGRGYFLSPLRGSTSDEPWILPSPHTLQITSPGAKRRQRVGPAVRPGNIVSMRTSAEGAAPCIHTPTSESRFKLEISRGWLRSGGKITLLPIIGITLETSPQWSAVYKKR
jgi:hypothetical protein